MIAAEGRRADAAFVGRASELGILTNLTSGARPSIVFVTGIAGIGKSRLLEEFAARRRAGGAAVVRIDARLVEPTPEGFVRELSRALGGEIDSTGDAVERLAELGTVVLVIDDADALRLLDTWLRRTFVPVLPENVHVVFSGRDAPSAAWLQVPHGGALRMFELEPLDDDDALRLLDAGGVDAAQARRLNAVARGHPLALSLAAITVRDAADPALEEIAVHRMIDELARRHLGAIADPVARRAVEAAALVRTATAPLLGAMLPDVAPGDAYERLRSVPLVHLGRDGLKLHDSVRDAIARDLRSRDPDRYLALRRACWTYLVRRLRTAPVADLWRYTADLLYLLENPVVREAFFPSSARRYVVEPARRADAMAIAAIARRYDGEAAARATASWLDAQAAAFGIAREPTGAVAAYYVIFEASTLPAAARSDAVLRAWVAHLEAHPVEPNERVLFLRRWLSVDHGEAPCPAQAACWVDIKRVYMSHRPNLRRVYLALREPAPYLAAAAELGFTVLDECAAALDGGTAFTAMLDFGPDSVDGWFARLVAAELGIATRGFLDVGAREVIEGATRTPLTRREFDTLQYLLQRAGGVVHRDDILTDVWGEASDIGSNVVDVAIRSLRKKLGARASVIQTVPGVGYRLRDDER
ncbi:MAG TPA: winged helix-turn-helix domain-containing protein [Candidatus Elarobacter sp.]|jgi:hypothetical protein|nr:winged helix-turn-helix domain-containing protein [Candidatus Elarobacter sp.]